MVQPEKKCEIETYITHDIESEISKAQETNYIRTDDTENK